MDYIVRRVREEGEVLFSTICKELGMTRESIVVTFLAILELVRRRRLSFDQKAPFDDIRLFLVAKV
jgi:chromatin segregation and condensation protein Rec8/ScpA/Scc1 (kleisin family)